MPGNVYKSDTEIVRQIEVRESSSIDMPLRFSSSKRSVSMPVSARTRLVFPWSMWPAVPAITCFTLLLLLVCPAFAQESDVTFKASVANVRVDAQVTQDGELITGLTAQDFVVREDDRPQPIVYFGREKEPLSLLLLLDVSGSMRKYVEQVASVARQSLRFLRVKDRVALMVFAREANVRMTSPMT